MDRAVGDYVIVHELLHFSVPHHGKLWKALMRAHLGDYEKLDRKLKQSAMRRLNGGAVQNVFFITAPSAERILRVPNPGRATHLHRDRQPRY